MGLQCSVGSSPSSIPIFILTCQDVSKSSILLEALSDNVFIRSQTWESPIQDPPFSFLQIAPTEPHRQTLMALRPGDVLSIESHHFHFPSQRSPTLAADADRVQVRSSGVVPNTMTERPVVPPLSHSTSLADVGDDEIPLTSRQERVREDSSLEQSENTISGLALTPSFAKPSEPERQAEETRHDEESLFIPQEEQLPHHLPSMVESTVDEHQKEYHPVQTLVADSFALHTERSTSVARKQRVEPSAIIRPLEDFFMNDSDTPFQESKVEATVDQLSADLAHDQLISNEGSVLEAAAESIPLGTFVADTLPSQTKPPTPIMQSPPKNQNDDYSGIAIVGRQA